jgi:thioredoxin-related protein
MMGRATNLVVALHLAAGLILVAGPTWAQEAPEDERPGIHWLSYREALATGRDTDKPILLHFTAPYSEDSRKMKRETYRELKVIRYLNEHFAVAMVDIEELPSLARKYKVESLPTLWFLDASGKALTSINGLVGAEKLLRVTEYISQKIYLHTDYDTWLYKHHGR